MNEDNLRCRRERVQAVVDEEVENFRREKVIKARKKVKSRKAVGPDNIPMEVWKHTGD